MTTPIWYNGGVGSLDCSKLTTRMVAGDRNGDGTDEIGAVYDNGASQTRVFSWDRNGSENNFKLNTDLWNSYAVKVADPTGSATTTLLKSIQNGSNAAISYTYDANGNITEIREGTTLKASYVYDSLNQLVRENNTYTNKTVAYAYDLGGNIQSKTDYAYTTGDLGTPTATIHYSYTDSTWKDLLTNYNNEIDANGNPVVYQYDTIGNPLVYRDGMAMTWQNGRQLAGIGKTGLTTSYQYDDSGMRIKKTANGVVTDYYLNGSSILAEVTGGIQTDYYYDESGNLFGFKKGGAEYYYIRNGQNDIIGILDSTGNQVVSYVYDTWGKLISVTGSMASTIGASNPFRYRGYYYDAETGLFYVGSRYYDPVTGRFINADGMVDTDKGILSHNMFAYCENDPVNRYDPDGMAWVYNGITYKYDGSRQDCYYKDHGIAPRAYTRAVRAATNYSAYLNAIGDMESGNNYGIKNRYGYLGRWQLGTLALKDIGFMDSKGKWTKLAKDNGVTSEATFLTTASAQDAAIDLFNKKQWGYIKSYKLTGYIGTKYCGVLVTESGLLAACHLVGVGSVANALRTGKSVCDGNGTTASSYMSKFGGYNISCIY